MAIVVVRLIVLAAATAAGLRARRRRSACSDRNVWLGGAGLLVGVLVVLLEWQARRVPVDRLFWGATGGILGVAFGLGLGSALGAVVPGAGALGPRALRAAARATWARRWRWPSGTSSRRCRSKLFPRRVGGPERRQDPRHLGDHRRAHRGASARADSSSGTLARAAVRAAASCSRSPTRPTRSGATAASAASTCSSGCSERQGRRVRIETCDFPQVREVDRKLIELARATGGKIVTNDYNLNQAGRAVSGVAVLNINELASALRPVVLPGEPMQVHLVKEGKEAGQGVGLPRRRHHGRRGARQAAHRPDGGRGRDHDATRPRPGA